MDHSNVKIYEKIFNFSKIGNKKKSNFDVCLFNGCAAASVAHLRYFKNLLQEMSILTLTSSSKRFLVLTKTEIIFIS